MGLEEKIFEAALSQDGEDAGFCGIPSPLRLLESVSYRQAAK